MQPAIRDTCSIDIDGELNSDDRTDEPNIATLRIRRRISDALNWLDSYWDDPELRSGFWNSGW